MSRIYKISRNFLFILILFIIVFIMIKEGFSADSDTRKFLNIITQLENYGITWWVIVIFIIIAVVVWSMIAESGQISTMARNY